MSRFTLLYVSRILIERVGRENIGSSRYVKLV